MTILDFDIMHMLRINLSALLLVSSSVFIGCSNARNDAETEPSKVRPSEGTRISKHVSADEKNILFYGTSLTAGYGLDQQEAYPALIQKKIDSLQLDYKVINGGLSGETSAAGKSRIDWQMKQPIAVFVLELGANDGLRGLPVKQTQRNLQSIIDKVKRKYPHVKMVMLGMQMPPSMGEKYANDFKLMFQKVADQNEMVYVPFLLDGVGGVANLNQDDGIHPTAEGQKILAENVWRKLKDIL